jgi:Tol biopolymer transport system component
VRAWLALLAGCGRIGFAVVSNGDATPRCTQWGPFDPPVQHPELSSIWDDWGPSISLDDTTFYRSDWSSTTSLFGVSVYQRAAPGLAFAGPTRLSLESANTWAYEPSISRDGNTLYLGMGQAGAEYLGFATRTGPMSFSVAQAIPELRQASGFQNAPWISPDELRLYFSGNNVVPAAGNGEQLAVATRASTGDPFGAPELLGGVQSPQDESSPGLSQDELELFFVSNRPGGVGGYDLYRATRTDRTAAFDTVEALTQLSSARDEQDPELSADGTTLYYTYNTLDAGGANANIWTATRACLAF